MANTSNTKGSTANTPAVAASGVSVNTTSVSAVAASGSSSGASVPGMGPATVIKPPSGFRNVVQQLVDGINKDIPVDSPLTVVGTQMTQAQLLAILQPVLDGFTAIDEAETSVTNARLSLSALLPQARQFIGNLKAALIAQFGKGSPLLADFGVKDGSSVKKLSTAAAAAKVVKASETRALRNTQGKAAKQSVKFTGEVAPASAVPAGGAPGPSGTSSTVKTGA